MNSLAHTSATTTTALSTPCQAPLPTWEENAHSIWDENEISLGEIVVDAYVKSDCTALTGIKRDRAPTLEKHAVAFEPFWDPNEASLDSIADESDDVAAARIALDFDQMFASDADAENAPAVFEPQQADEAPVNAQSKNYNYNCKVCVTCTNPAQIMNALAHESGYRQLASPYPCPTPPPPPTTPRTNISLASAKSRRAT